MYYSAVKAVLLATPQASHFNFMKAQTSNLKSRRVHPGTIVLGNSFLSKDAGLTYRILFCCRKNSFDFLGQVNVDSTQVKLELFNDNYFDLFEKEKNEVMTSLEGRVLKSVLQKNNLPENFRSLVQTHLKKISAHPCDEVRQDLAGTPAAEKDLRAMYARLNREYFDGGMAVEIEWGKNVKTANRRSLRFGSYDSRKKLIRIHPRLKQDFVPLAVLELTIYHEMCHDYLPPVKRNGQWQTHHRDFKRKEREFCHYREAMQWEKAHWAKLLAPSPPES